MRVERLVACACLSVLLAGCSAPVSDTGFAGSWKSMGEKDSKISLRQDGDAYAFRWEMNTEKRRVRCPEAGRCEEFLEDKQIYEYRFRTFRKEDSPDLFIECRGEPKAAGFPEISYVDRVVLQPGGLSVWSYMIEMNGEELEQAKGPVIFTKSSDEPF